MDVILKEYGNTVCPAGWRAVWEEEFHHKIYFCKGGSAYYLLKGTRHNLMKNHFYIFPMLTKCVIFHDDSDPFEVLWFHMDTTPLIGNEIVKLNADDSLYAQYLFLLENSMDFGHEVLEPLLKSLLTLCVLQGELQHQENNNILKVLAYINENIANPLSNEGLSKILSYNKNYFIRYFKKHTGITPHSYIRIVRLNRAKTLLKDGVSVKKTAEMCGFSDENVLRREIKKHYKVPASVLCGRI